MRKSVIHWFRRDLRLTDNTALHHAAKNAEQVVPVYVLSDWRKHHHWTGNIRQSFLCGNLESLAKNLESLGSRLIICQGRADEALERLIQEVGAEAVYTNRDPDPFGKAMEQKVAAMCRRLGVEFQSFQDCVLHGPEEVLTGEGKPYRVFTPYSRNWLALPKPQVLPAVKKLGPTPRAHSLALPTLDTWGLPTCHADLPQAGERAARLRMKHFVSGERLASYKGQRDLPAVEGTSRLSQDLRFGLISIRELYHRCAAAAGHGKGSAESIQTYLKELAWREFYMAVLHHWPEVLETSFDPQFREMGWESDEKLFEAWSQGRTGFPIVDAGMRQLLATGFMHNRVRMIVSMFLTKDLHVHWLRGESFFMQHLVDGEIASNNGGWQWSAGTGADAAPYFRIQNPWTQTKTYDPNGAYIKKWVPELAKVTAEHLMRPAERPLHPDYPLPIVDHGEEREKTLAAFKKAKVRS